MKRIFYKIKKVILMVLVLLYKINTNVFATQSMYAAPNNIRVPYNEPKISVGEKIIMFCKNFIVPIAFIIGIIIYFKKSKKSTRKKIVVALIIGILCFILWSILNYMNG